ncbi:MAG: GNAT family N-acetyltransferase [Rhodospirillaceae bacterium]|nr:GNAT family N-acetyltransferase [Rhodospirillaceae bacterium]
MTAIILRPAVFDDWALLLDWVNQPDSLAWKSRTTDPIDAQAHKTWLKRFLENGESRIFVVLIADEPVGQIRFQADAECVFVIDVYVEANRRGDGVAQQALASKN